MSASLVGSEMCIRDRAGTGSAPPTAFRQAWPQRSQTTTPAPPRPSEPVSYTHLTLPTICSV
eukprot:2916556-Alexandrium_andersonii.AAC.1